MIGVVLANGRYSRLCGLSLIILGLISYYLHNVNGW